MYCKQCGNKISEGSFFCDKCGAKIEIVETNINEMVQVGNETVTPNNNSGDAKEICATEIKGTESIVQETTKVNSDFVVNLMGSIKGFFSSKTVQTVQNAAKSSGLEWIVYMGISALMCAFAVALNAKSLIKGFVDALMNGILGVASGLTSNNLLGSAVGSLANPIVRSAGDVVTDSLFNFGIWFIGGLLIGAATYFAISSVIYCGMKLVMKVDCKMQCIFNMVSVATFPMTLIFALNIILGFIWLPLVVVSFVIGVISSAVLLYVGMQKLEKIDKSPYWTYVFVMAVASLLVVIIAVIVIAIALTGMTSGISNLASSMGNLF